MTDNVQSIGIKTSSVREHIAKITAMDPSALVTFTEKDGQWRVEWSCGEPVDIFRMVGILQNIQTTLLKSVSN